MTNQQEASEALRLAGLLELAPEDGVEPQTTEDAAAELRRLHAENETLRAAAQAVIDRWNTPLWKDVEPTAAVIWRLRAAVASEQTSAWGES